MHLAYIDDFTFILRLYQVSACIRGCIFCMWPILWKEHLRRGCRDS